MKRRLLVFAVFLLVAGCAPSYSFRAHWQNRIWHLSGARDKSAAHFELEEYLRAFPADAHAHALKARMDGIDAKDAPFIRSLPDDGPWGAWRMGAVAENENNFNAAIKHYGQAANLAPGERLFLESYATCLLKCGRYKAAGEVYMDALRMLLGEPLPYPPATGATGFGLLLAGHKDHAAKMLSPLLPRTDLDSDFYLALGLAYLKKKQYEKAVDVFERADVAGKLSPECRDIYRLAMYRFLKELRARGLHPCGEALAAKAAALFPGTAVMRAYRAVFLDRMGRTAEAAVEFEKALANGPYHIETVRAARLFFVKRGRRLEAYRIWERAIPRSVLLGEENALRGKIERIRNLSEKLDKGAAGIDDRIGLAQAYRDFGWVLEAREQYLSVLRDSPLHKTAYRECREVTAHIRLLGEVETYFASHYEKLLNGAGVGIDEVTSDIAALISKTCGVDMREDACWSAMFFGSECNPVSSPRHPLVRYFMKYGQYFSLQQVYGQYPECKLMNLVFRAHPRRRLPGPGKEYEVFIGDECRVKALAGHLTGRPRIAGTASYSSNGYYLDLTAIRPGLGEVKMLVCHGQGSPAPCLVHARDSYRERAGKGGLFYSPELLRGLLGSGRKNLGVKKDDTSPNGLDEAFQRLFSAEVANIGAHELGHVWDFTRLIPFLPHILRNAWVVVSHGFSAHAITVRCESIAETHGLFATPYPYVNLAANLRWLQSFHEKPFHHVLLFFPAEDVEDSPYHHVARNLFTAIKDYVETHPDEFPEVDFSSGVFEQIHKLSPDALRKIATGYLARLGLP